MSLEMTVESQDGDKFNFPLDWLRQESEYFRAMLDSGMMESSERKVSLPCITSEGLGVVQRYCSSMTAGGQAKDFVGDSDIGDVLHTATYLQMPGFLNACEGHFVKAICHDNIYEVLEIAETYSLDGLLCAAESHICENLVALWKNDEAEFYNYYEDPVSLKLLLSDDALRVDEIDVFNIITGYVEHKRAKQESEATREKIYDLFSCPRYPLMSREKFDVCNTWLRSKKKDRGFNAVRDIFKRAAAYFEQPNYIFTKCNEWTAPRCAEAVLLGCGGFTHSEKSTRKVIRVSKAALDRSCTDLSALQFKKVEKQQQLPCSLVEHGACVLHGCVYVAGGQTTYCQDGRYTNNSLLRYDPRMGTWTQLANMSKPRSLFYLGVLGGHIYAVCGWLGPNSVTKSVERYNVLTDSWNDAASVPLGLHEHAGCSHQGNLYVSGGYKGPFQGHLDSVFCYDPLVDNWSRKAPLTHKRSYHIMASIGDRVYVTGGVNYIGNDAFEDVLVMELYDPVVNQWSDIGRLARPASCMSHHVYGNRLLLFGGHSFEDDSDHEMLQIYNTETGQMSECAIMSDNVQYFPLVEVPHY